ncbi:hypothetical protein AMTRI_Chr12g234200 [Amborella trichopoda]
MDAARHTIFQSNVNSPAPLTILDMNKFSFCNKSSSYSIRAKDLLGNSASRVAKLGLPKYKWSSEVLHGVSNIGRGTHFDAKIAPGATCFPNVVSTKARAMFNLGMPSLTYWSPNINVVRDPRWGCKLETPGGDLYTVGCYATNYVGGLQDVIERDMVETMVRPFEMCIKDGDVSSVMCSYNRLLGDTIRVEWTLNGYIVSDCDSLEVMYHGHQFLNDTQEDIVAKTMRARLDLDCGNYYPNYTYLAIQQGKIGELDADKALVNLYIVQLDSHCRDTNMFEDVVCASKTTDATVLILGLDIQIEAECRDRNDIFLSGQQVELINIVMAIAGGLIMSGGVDINLTKNNWFVRAMLWAGSPDGEGESHCRCHLWKIQPWWPAPSHMGYAGRTYKIFTGQTIYPIGYGMRYSYFNYTLKSIPDVGDLSLSQNQLFHKVTYTNDAPTRPPSCASVLVSDSSCK